MKQHHSLIMKKKRRTYVKYSSRFLIAFLLCSNSLVSGYLYSTFVSIWKDSEDYFDVDSQAVNMLGNIYNVCFVPGSFLAIFLTERFGVSRTVIFGSLLNTLGSWIRYIGSAYATYQKAYGIVIFGQFITAFGQPLIINLLSRISNDWFPENERNFAMFIMIQSNVVGVGLGALIPSYQIRQEGDIPNMLLSQAITAFSILFITCLMQDRPPTPPGRDVEKQILLQTITTSQKANGENIFIFRKSLDELNTIITNGNFIMLLIGFSFIGGAGYTVFNVVGQLIQPCGYTENETGIAAGVLTFASIIGNVFIVLILLCIGVTYQMNILKQCFVLYLIAALLVLGLNQPGNFGLLLLAWIFLGCCFGPIIPLGLESAVEIAYPIPAETVAAVMFTGSCLVSMILTPIITPLLTLPESTSCRTIFTPAAFLFAIIVAIGVLCILMVRPELNRVIAAHDTDDDDAQLLEK